MMKQFLANVKLHRKTGSTLLFCMLAFFLIGFFMVWFIVGVLSEESTWFPAGSLMTAVGIIIFSFFGYISYYQEFMLALSMGRTRKEFLLLYALEQLLRVTAAYLVMILLTILEELLYSRIFPDMPGEISLVTFLTDWRVILPSITALVILPMFFGALYSHFGKRFDMVIYCIWLFTVLVLPRLADRLEHKLYWNIFETIPVFGWILFGAAAAAAMILTTVKLGMKQMVR